MRAALRGSPCRPLVDTPKVLSGATSTYPDVVVVCGPLDPGATVLESPVLIVEVLSASTEDEDRGAKWACYRSIPSLAHYLLVEQRAPHVEVFTRTATGWDLRIVDGLDATVPLTALDATLPLAEVYEDVPGLGGER